MKVLDYYKTLGVSKSASEKEIKSAYRKLARQHHPDVNPGDKASEERFKEINEAYEVLSDASKRQKYDQFGAQWQQYERAGGRPEDFNWSQWGGGQTGSTRGVSQEEFEQMFGSGGNFSDFFETLFGGRAGGRSSGGFDFGNFSAGGQQYQSRPRKGRDSEFAVQVTLEEAFHGTTRSLQWENGRTLEAKIPRGVDTGSRIRLSGQGQPGAAGAPAGDLYLTIELLPHATFQREGDDLKVAVPVDLYTALLGGQSEVRTLDKSVNLTIPAETPNGKVFRLRGLGMPKLKNPDQRGDLYVTVDVQLPRQLSAPEKELLAQLRGMRRAA
jgi:curved DNA-binding protein